MFLVTRAPIGWERGWVRQVVVFAALYPTLGLGGFLGANRVQGAGLGADLRRCCVRAYNTMAADMFREYSDRMTPAAIIPTPRSGPVAASVRFR